LLHTFSRTLAGATSEAFAMWLQQRRYAPVELSSSLIKLSRGLYMTCDVLVYLVLI